MNVFIHCIQGKLFRRVYGGLESTWFFSIYSLAMKGREREKEPVTGRKKMQKIVLNPV